jgi:hypothetical protein
MMHFFQCGYRRHGLESRIPLHLLFEVSIPPISHFKPDVTRLFSSVCISSHSKSLQLVKAHFSKRDTAEMLLLFVYGTRAFKIVSSSKNEGRIFFALKLVHSFPISD